MDSSSSFSNNSKSNIQNPKFLIKNDILSYLKQHEEKEMLRFITCGSVDDGKSTLIGRLLYETKMVFKDHIMALKAEKKYKRTDEEIDFSLLVDGLQAEREQGITIDVAYRYFSSEKRKFIIADTPGHEQYTRNMVTGASTADLGVILIDARNGVLTQTRRHSFLLCLLGIRNLLVVVNKMDLVGYSKDIFEKIVHDYNLMFKQLKFSLPFKHFDVEIDFIPISALKGDNIVKLSENTPWYKGKAFLEYLNTVKILNSSFKRDAEFRFPVQYINRPNEEFRGYCGNIASGVIRENDEIIVYPSKMKTKVKSIIPPLNFENLGKTHKYKTLKKAFVPMSITLVLEKDIDVSRGDLIVKEGEKEPKFNDSFEAMLVWMDEESLKNREYIIKLYTKETNAIISRILFKKDVNTWEKVETKVLELNDIARVQIDLAEEVAFDLYEENKTTGSFILIDRLTNNTVAAGIIVGESTKRKKKRIYTESEIALNKFIREHYPEWGCKSIDEIE
ncbi:sulfate adenylyltransferase subunit 1 [Thermotomaculum hydrothermale]|uniref:sulfate adenylyltransferase n=1 Tax=Thermotomaculum hydrothermale TaxID=981385 RepID=A0A7R6T043_9BACT|nr:sulfate adenylyltransferase subunit CysN [Thermotomaculum hydrothermale]BBB33405.1 sulfate adenylyltransferase subunit 1 [Thermotomaculum hydrothermale]